MGSVGAGLASVGGSLAEARELQRRQQLEDIKQKMEQTRLATEQEQLKISQRYADIAGLREKRLSAAATQPTVSKWQLTGNTMIAAGQNPDGSPFVKTFPLNKEVGAELKALQDEISQAPPEIQPILNSMTWSKIAEGDIKGAANDIKPILQSYAKSKFPQQDTVREGFTTQTVDIPGYGPVIVQVPTRSVSRKVPAGSVMGGLPEAAPEAAPEQIPTPLTSGARDRPGAPQSSAGGPTITTSGLPKIPLPPGSRMVGVKPPPGSKGQLKPEMEAGLRVLHTALWGSPVAPGLDSTVGVLDSFISRQKLIAAGVGSTPNPNEWLHSIMQMSRGAAYSGMSDAEKKYVYQLNRAISAINALRSITGLPRSTQALMDRYVMELPNPVTTPSSKDARNQLQLIEREIQAAVNDATGTSGTAPAAPTVPDANNPLGLNIK